MFADVNKSNAEYTKYKSNDKDNEDSHSAEEEQNTEDSESVKTQPVKKRGRPKKLSGLMIVNHHLLKTKTNGLSLTDNSIVVTSQSVHDILGIPMGGCSLESLEPRSPDDPFIKEWLSQFVDKNEVRPNDITDVIVSTKDAGKLFKMNFLMLFANTMGLCEKSGVCNMNILKKITDDVCVEKIDWCSYIIKCLKESKQKWVNADKNQYTGPVTFMILNKLVKKFEEDFKKKDLVRNDENDDTTATTNDKNDLLHFDSKMESDSHVSDDDNQNSVDDDGKQDVVMDEIDKQNKEDICKEDNGDQTVEHNDSNEDTGNTDSAFVDIQDEHNNDDSEHSNNADAKSKKEDEESDALAITICNVCHPVPLRVLMPNENLKDFLKIINIEDSKSKNEEFDFGGDTDNEEKYDPKKDADYKGEFYKSPYEFKPIELKIRVSASEKLVADTLFAMM
nr:ulp1 protease family, C-terminal catalytic domain-containing protein [Tanacetum cinerariifolium]